MQNRMKLPLFDDYWIDFRCNVQRRWFAPEPYSIVPGGAYCSMFYDPSVEKYRIYYEELTAAGKDAYRTLKLVESHDLVHFTQVLSEDGTDVIYDGVTGLHGCSVLYDPEDPNADRRYKLCGMMDMKRHEQGKQANDWLGVEIAMSPDGIHWTRHPELLASPQTSDSLNKLTYNPALGEYVLMHRSAYVDRRISVRTSKDLVHWTEPRVILQPGPSYNNDGTAIQHYSMTTRYMDGLFYGLVWRYNTGLYNLDYSRMFGYMEPELVYSYDGREYLQTTNRALIERPYAPAPGCAGLSPQEICEDPQGENYYVLCSGQIFTHGTETSNRERGKALAERRIWGGCPIYRIRKDGFCGLESIGKGRIITKGICLLKDDLTFNLRANCGEVRFGIMDLMGRYYPGFEPENCAPYRYEDGVQVHPAWADHDLSELLGKQVRVEVLLDNAMIHCISATARPYIRQLGRSFAEPEGIPEGNASENTRGTWLNLNSEKSESV